mmetsp:Transcript_57425/g.159839  ORF Transcript_57425/g.159839 Transcript_57425/m.159839 type:complete len:277 (+) Transcript_57425:569-1399(+)
MCCCQVGGCAAVRMPDVWATKPCGQHSDHLWHAPRDGGTQKNPGSEDFVYRLVNVLVMSVRRRGLHAGLGDARDESQNVALVAFVRNLGLHNVDLQCACRDMLWKPCLVLLCAFDHCAVPVVCEQRRASANRHLFKVFTQVRLGALGDHGRNVKHLWPLLVFSDGRRNVVFQCAPSPPEWSGQLVHEHYRADASLAHDRHDERRLEKIRLLELLEIVLVVRKGAHPVWYIRFQLVLGQVKTEHVQRLPELCPPPMTYKPSGVLRAFGDKIHEGALE